MKDLAVSSYLDAGVMNSSRCIYLDFTGIVHVESASKCVYIFRLVMIYCFDFRLKNYITCIFVIKEFNCIFKLMYKTLDVYLIDY